MFKYGFLSTLSENFKVYDTCDFPMNLNLPPPLTSDLFLFFKNDHALPLLPPSIPRERNKKPIQPSSLLGPKLRKERERTWIPFPPIPY